MIDTTGTYTISAVHLTTHYKLTLSVIKVIYDSVILGKSIDRVVGVVCSSPLATIGR